MCFRPRSYLSSRPTPKKLIGIVVFFHIPNDNAIRCFVVLHIAPKRLLITGLGLTFQKGKVLFAACDGLLEPPTVLEISLLSHASQTHITHYLFFLDFASLVFFFLFVVFDNGSLLL